jgi:hypothetical protein
MYAQNPNSATSLPNTKFIFLKQVFIIPCGLSLPMRPNARVLGWSVSCQSYYVLYISIWNCQMLAAEQLLPGQTAWVALPSIHHGKNQSYLAIIFQLSWSGRESRWTLPHLPVHPPPPSTVTTCVLYKATSAAHRTHDIQEEYSNERCQIFFANILLGSCPSPHHSWYSHNGSPLLSYS